MVGMGLQNFFKKIKMNNIKRICLWSSPRNISTALMYSFGQRNDTRVYDEPLYGYYLRHSRAKEYHPGAEKVLTEMETDGDKVIRMMMGPHDWPVVFFKNMTHHLPGLDRGFMKNTINVLLTRDPLEMLPSIAKVIPAPVMADVGYALQSDLLAYLEKIKNPPIVLDARRLLLNPRGVLKQLCEKAGIPFDEKMLRWKAGPRPEDGSWAQYWYANVHRSTGFMEYKPKTEPFPEHLRPLLHTCLPHYRRLEKMALR